MHPRTASENTEQQHGGIGQFAFCDFAPAWVLLGMLWMLRLKSLFGLSVWPLQARCGPSPRPSTFM
jgi:hypothetical protein